MFGFHYQLLTPGDRSGLFNLVDDHADRIAFKVGPLGIAATVLSFILWAALVTLLVLLAIYFVQRIRQSRGSGAFSSGPERALPLHGKASAPAGAPAPELLRLLDERYAKGEIDHEDYALRKANLLGLKTQPPSATGQSQPTQDNPEAPHDQPGQSA